MSCLYSLILSFRNGDSDDFLNVLKIFDPLLKKLHKQSFSSETYSELVLFLIQLLNNLPLHEDKFKEDKYLIAYISKSIKNHYVYFNKKISNMYD